ncbi:MAG: circadian clock protein KaiC [Desulfamplus sp.]|nr:circadian clock protein KaiC [Desulfamplus sp.]
MNQTYQLPKVSSGISGLDEILEGGFPKNRTCIINGGPGCGKTNFSMEFIYDGAKNGEPGIFISFEETVSALRQNALTIGFDLEPLEKEGKLILLDNPLSPEVIVAGKINLEGLRVIIDNMATRHGIKRVVFDALDVLLNFFDSNEERKEIFLFQKLFRKHGITAIFTTKPVTPDAFATYEFMDSLVDCVIYLDQRVVNQITTLILRVKKYRGSRFGRNECPYTIGVGGINIIPISTLGLRHKPLGSYVSSGLQDLDKVLGGGYRRASSVLIAGVTGTGKTSLAATFACSVCEKGENLLYISFEESQDAMVNNMLSPGIDLRHAQESGRFHYISGLPESLGSEEHLLRAFREIENFKPEHVVIDAISACHRMGSERASFDFLVRILNICKDRGITCIMLNQTVSPSSIQELSGIEISSVIDAVISLHYVEVSGEINRTLICIKSRGSRHSNQYREYLITDNGITLLPVYTGVNKMLTGTARHIQEEKDRAAQIQLEQKIETKEYELKVLKSAQEELKKSYATRAIMRGDLKNPLLYE